MPDDSARSIDGCPSVMLLKSIENDILPGFVGANWFAVLRECK